MKPKLIMINVTNHKYPYGTILQAISEQGKTIYVALIAEQGNCIRVNKASVRDL